MTRLLRSPVALLLLILAACGASQPRQLIREGQYDRTNSPAPFNEVRSVAIDPLDGYIWVGFTRGIATYNGQNWNLISGTGIVNDISPTKGGMLFAVDETSDGAGGLFQYHYQRDQTSRPLDDMSVLLPNKERRIYHIESAEDANYLSTYEGVVRSDGTKFELVYSATLPNNIYSDHVHTTLHAKSRDVWIGHIEHGVSWYRKAEGRWVTVTMPLRDGQYTTLGSDKVRALVELPDGRIMIGTDGGGITEYNPNAAPEANQWRTFGLADGVADSILDLAVDKHDRLWAATDRGVFYLTGHGWQRFHPQRANDTHAATSIAFGEDCRECFTNSDTIVIGTAQHGIIVGIVPPK